MVSRLTAGHDEIQTNKDAGNRDDKQAISPNATKSSTEIATVFEIGSTITFSSIPWVRRSSGGSDSVGVSQVWTMLDWEELG